MSGGSPIDGVYAALPTPFDDGGRIDQKALDHIVDYLVSQQVRGIALLTEAAEDPLLSPEERRSLISTITGRVKSKKPVQVHISAPSTREAVELAKYAQTKGATSIAIAPYRLPGYGYRELYRHIDRIAKSVELPLLLVVRPENAIDALDPEEVATLAKHPGLKGAFVADTTPATLETWSKRYKKKEGHAVLSSSSLTFSAAAKAGAVGSVCGMAVVACDQAAKLYATIEKKENEAAMQMERKLAPAVEMLGPPRRQGELDGVHKLATKLAQRPLEGSSLASVVPFALIKETLRLQGHPIRNRVRPPYEQVAADISERLKSALKVSGLIT